MLTVPISSVPVAMRMKYRVTEGILRRSVRVWTEALKHFEALDEPFVHTIDSVIDDTVYEGVVDPAIVYESLVEFEGWQPLNLTYLMVYARLLDRGYSVKFDVEYFAELPLIPEGVMRRGEG